MSFGNYYGNLALDYLLNARWTWAALHTSNPGSNGAPSTEVAGASYTRLLCDFSAAGAKNCANSTVLEWENLPSCSVTHGGVWDSEFGGQIIAYGVFLTPRSITYGSQLIVPAGMFAVAI